MIMKLVKLTQNLSLNSVFDQFQGQPGPKLGQASLNLRLGIWVNSDPGILYAFHLFFSVR